MLHSFSSGFPQTLVVRCYLAKAKSCQTKSIYLLVKAVAEPSNTEVVYALQVGKTGRFRADYHVLVLRKGPCDGFQEDLDIGNRTPTSTEILEDNVHPGIPIWIEFLRGGYVADRL